MNAPTLTRIPVASIVASPDQNRVVFDPRELEELAGSIVELGLLQPIVVRSEMSHFVLVAGERRLRAVRDLLGDSEIAAIVTDEPLSETAALRTLAENMVRVDPDPIAEARGLAQARDRYSIAEPAELARKLGKSPKWVAGRLARLGLSDRVAHFVETGALPLNRAALMFTLDANRQWIALEAHQSHVTTDVFTRLVARLADEQSAEAMFDPDAFLAVEEYVAEAQRIIEAEESPVIKVRETPLGMPEIAQLLEVKRQTVEQWRFRGLFPEPDLVVVSTPLWWRETITGWAEKTGRL